MSSSSLIHHVYPRGNANGMGSTTNTDTKKEAPLAPPPSLNNAPGRPTVSPEAVTSSTAPTPASAPGPLPHPVQSSTAVSKGVAPGVVTAPLIAPNPAPSPGAAPPPSSMPAPQQSAAIPIAVPPPSSGIAATSNSSLSEMTASPTFSIGSHEPPPHKHPPSYRLSSSAPSRTSRILQSRSNGKLSDHAVPTTHTTNPAASPIDRRQKRLERNRESARLSRRRRKQYLEVLEERVKNYSEEMDKGRFNHVSAAVKTVRSMRHAKLQDAERLLGLNLSSNMPTSSGRRGPQLVPALESISRFLDGPLSRTSDELNIAGTFRREQLKSLILPPPTKFVLWLTLQNDVYFRGGRAASERLSAARIGERMLQSGNDRVGPANGMWPLFCNEIGLSYDQEERVRNFQRNLLTDQKSWLHRHTAAASGIALKDMHAAIHGTALMAKKREKSILNVLTVEQRVKFLAWAARKSPVIAKIAKVKAPAKPFVDNSLPKISKDIHDAANLYIVNHRIKTASEKLPATPLLVHGSALRRLSRRPSFESLAGSSASLADAAGKPLSRDASFSSTGSLKRTVSEQSCSDLQKGSDSMDEGDKNGGRGRDHAGAITPEAAQNAAVPVVSASLGCVASIVPPPPPRPEFVVAVQHAPPPPQPYPAQQQQYIPHPQQLQYTQHQQPQYYPPPPQPQQYQPQTLQQPPTHYVTAAPMAPQPQMVPSTMVSYAPPAAQPIAAAPAVVAAPAAPIAPPVPAPLPAVSLTIPNPTPVSMMRGTGDPTPLPVTQPTALPSVNSAPVGVVPVAPTPAPVPSAPVPNASAPSAPMVSAPAPIVSAPAQIVSAPAPTTPAPLPTPAPAPLPTPAPAPLPTPAPVSAPAPIPPPSTTQNQTPPADATTHPHAIPSLLPAHMNIVPEDGYLNNVTMQGGDEFLFDLTEEDWAIGEGFEMDVS